jgi:hypothetical protein
MISDKWKEFLVKKEGLHVIRFDQTAFGTTSTIGNSLINSKSK